MRILALLIVFFLFLFGCNNLKQKEIHPSIVSNIDYNDKGLELNDGNNITKFRIINVSIYGDTININYSDSLQDYAFYIHYLKDSSWCEFVQQVSMTDSSYRKPFYKMVKKNIHLQLEKEKYTTSELTGNIYVEIERHHTWVEDFKDTVIISGLLNTRLN